MEEEEESQPDYTLNIKYNPLDDDGERERIDNFLEDTIRDDPDFRPDFREPRTIPLNFSPANIATWDQIAKQNRNSEPIYNSQKFKDKKKKIIPFESAIDPFLTSSEENIQEPTPKIKISIYHQSDLGKRGNEDVNSDDEFAILPKRELTIQTFLVPPKEEEDQCEEDLCVDDWETRHFDENGKEIFVLDSEGIPLRWGKPKPVDVDVRDDLVEEDVLDELQDFDENEIDYPDKENGMDLDAFNGQY